MICWRSQLGQILMQGFRNAIGALLVALVVLSISSCGGGTSGTDAGTSLKIAGFVGNSDGNAVQGARITVSESGDSGETDAAGKFSIDTVVVGERVQLLVEGDGSSSEIDLGERPAEASRMQVALSIESATGAVSVVSIDVTPLVQSPASRQPTPTPGANQEGRNEVGYQSSLSGLIVTDGTPTPVSRVSVRASPGGSDASGSDGRFRLEFPTGSRSIRLTFRALKLNEVVTINGIPNYPVAITATFKLTTQPSKGPGNIPPSDPSGRMELASIKFSAR